MTKTMTAPDGITPQPYESAWRYITGVFKLSPDHEFDARIPCPAPPFSETWPYDGMVVTEELAPGCMLNRYYCRYTNETPWLEIVFNAEIQ